MEKKEKGVVSDKQDLRSQIKRLRTIFFPSSSNVGQVF